MCDQSSLAEQQTVETASATANRREWIRYRTDRQTVCQPFTLSEDDVWWEGRLLDVSQGGIGLLLTRRFEAGTVLVVEFRDAASEKVRPLMVQVRHVTERADGWHVGCQSLIGIGDQEVDALR